MCMPLCIRQKHKVDWYIVNILKENEVEEA